jgi:mannitol/fructose-specific phosphotransferase system IIA component (Ntr-type)
MNAEHLKSSHFADYLQNCQVIYDLKAKTKVEAFEELLDLLKENKLIKNRKPVLTRVIAREELVSTGIGHGIALPHARMDTGQELAVAVGWSSEGLEFDAIDGQKVHLIILIVWNPVIPGLFNHVFAGIAKFLSSESYRDRLFNAGSGEELCKILSEIELELPEMDDRIIHRAGLLWKLQEIELLKKKASAKEAKEFQAQSDLIRSELDSALVERFDRFMERYGFAVAEVQHGVCMGCYINVATGMGSAIAGSNDLYVCENCGKFLVGSKSQEE